MLDRLGRLGIVACALVATWHVGATARAQSQDSATKKMVAVEVANPAMRRMVRELMVPATLVADEQVDLYAKTSGYVEMIEVNIGSVVSEGDVLVRIAVPEMKDDERQALAVLEAKKAKAQALQAKGVQAERMVDIARAQVQRYSAQQALDRITLTRREALHKGNAIPEQALDEAKSAFAVSDAQLKIAHAQVAGAEAEHQSVLADVKVAEADLMVVQANLGRLRTLMGYASIKAPFDGVITVRGVDHGTFVRSAVEGVSSSLLRVDKTSRIRVIVEIPEIDAAMVSAGTRATLIIKSLGNEEISATVSRVAEAIKADTRSMRAEIDLDNSDGRYRPGMYAQVTIQLEVKQQAMMIPSKAIRVHGKATVVMISADGIAKQLPITIGYDDGIWAEVLSGLEGNEAVISASGGAVLPGVSVKPVYSDS